MSKTATIQLQSESSEVLHLDGTLLPYAFDNAVALDVVNFVQESYNLPRDLMYQLKFPTTDLFGKAKIASLVAHSPIMDGEKYFLLISEYSADAPATPSQLKPRNVFQEDSNLAAQACASPSRAFGSLNVKDTPRRPVFGRAATPMEIIASAIDEQLSSRETTPTSQPSDTNGFESQRTSQEKTQPSQPTDIVTTESTSSVADGTVLLQQLHPSMPMNRASFLGDLYRQNKDIMDNVFAEMTQSEDFHFHDINVVERMAVPRNIAAFVLLRKEPLGDYNIRVGQIARESAQKLAVDLFMETKTASSIPRIAAKPLVDFFKRVTENNFFDMLLRPKSPLVEAARKREERKDRSNGFIPRKRTKIMFTTAQGDDIEKAAKAIAAAHTTEEVEVLIKTTSSLRSQWIHTMVQEKKPLIPEIVVSKFPMFKTNASWLAYDFQYTMENIYKKPVFNVSETLAKYATAIASVAFDKELISAFELETVESDMMKTVSTLIDLIGVYTKKKNHAQADRLIIESKELPSVEEMVQQRRDAKQIAPMIFVIRTSQGKQYFVSTDDFALEVHGNFGDALQCLIALHYVLYIEYAKELHNFNLFLENLCELNHKGMNKARENLLLDLKSKLRSLDTPSATQSSNV